MKKQVATLCAAALLAGIVGVAPGKSSAAASGSASSRPAAPTKKTLLSNEDTTSGTDPRAGNGDSSVGGNTGSGGGNSGGKTDNGGRNNEAGENAGSAEDTSAALIEKVIAEGMKYIGTPYLFGSNRSTTDTFDCSDFVRWIYKQHTDLLLPLDSRQQGAFVKKLGTAKTDWRSLKRGDLMFFMTYEGSTASDYRSVDKETERITHEALYLGNGKILHTYSNASGGVHVQSFAGSQWEYRFLFGGSVLTEK